MKEFHKNYACRPTETEKKGRRAKNQQKEGCKCFVPFVKLHYYDCPAIKKYCAVHKNTRHRRMKDDKLEAEQNMIISFHPSSKTERLFQPIKTLLAQCTPDTKVNLHYYSPKSTTSKESVRQQRVQAKSNDGERLLNSSVFVEKTKSFESDRTNKMKKLKQCFYSPCNSIVQKSQSQTSIKGKFQDIFRGERKKMSDSENFTPDKPPDDIKNDSNLMWFSNKFDYKNWEKISGEKTDSDFITVTHQAKKNLINHKIFEIKHKKGLNDFPYIKLPKQTTQSVYSTIDVKNPGKKSCDCIYSQGRIYSAKDESISAGEAPVEIQNKQKGDEDLSTSNSHDSSSSSVYFTPFIFVPAAATDTDNEYVPEPLVSSEAPREEERKQKTESLIENDPQRKSVQLQTDQSGDSANQEWYHRYTEIAESFTTHGTQTDEVFCPFEIRNSTEEFKDTECHCGESFTVAQKNFSDNILMRDKQTSTLINSSDFKTSKRKTPTETRKYVSEESVITTTRYTMTTTTTDKRCQTESVKTEEVYKRRSLKVNKVQIPTTKLSNKSTQTTFSLSESLEEVSEFIDLDSSNITYVIKSFDNQESDQTIDKLSKAWWGKSHSDSELFGRCPCLKPEDVIPLPHSCVCQPSGAMTNQTNQQGSAIKSRDINTLPKSSAKPVTEKKADKPQETRLGEHTRPETLRADKSVGTNSGGHRMYKRADKALGTDSLVLLIPEKPKQKQVNRVVPPTNDGRENTAPVLRSSPKADRSPKTAEFVSRAEQTSFKEEDPHIPVSDLSELTKIIQEFFEKAGKTSWRNCNCETQAVPETKTDVKDVQNSRKLKNEAAAENNEIQETPPTKEKKVVLDTTVNVSKGFQGEAANAEIPSDATSTAENCVDSNRIKIRRSVLLDENQTKTRFVCSVCAREISIFSINAATNTDNSHSCRKKENSTSVSAEISELIKVKTAKTVHSLDSPKRFNSAPESSAAVKGNKVDEGTSTIMSKPIRESPRTLHKSYIPTPKSGASAYSDQVIQSSPVMRPESMKEPVTPNTITTTTRTTAAITRTTTMTPQTTTRVVMTTPTTIRTVTKTSPTTATTTSTVVTTAPPTTTRTVTTTAPSTSNFLKQPAFTKCVCQGIEKTCDIHNCPKLDPNFNAATTSRAAQPKTDIPPSVAKSDYPGVPPNQSRNTRRSGDRSRSQRRSPENYFPVLIKSPWPREITLNVTEKSQNILDDSKSTTSQQKRSYEKELGSTETPAGKKIRAEHERASRHCFMFGEPASSDFQLESKFIPCKGAFYWIPSLSTSHVSSSKMHTLTHTKTIKSEEQMRGASHPTCQEGFSADGSTDLFSTKSCHPTPILLECQDQQSFEKLFECCFCKSLTFIKSNKDIMFPWTHGLTPYRSETSGELSSTEPNDDESLRLDDSSSQNLRNLFGEYGKLFDLSESPSTEELLDEETVEATEEERELKSQSPSSLDILPEGGCQC